MKLPKSLTTVTPLSKALAAILFISFPFLGFYLGMQYEREIHPQGTNQPSLFEKINCKKWETVCDPNSPNDANLGCAPMKICIDPSQAPTFIPASTSQPTLAPPAQNGIFCGGSEKISCPSGYVCKSDKDYPDPEGECVVNSNEIPPISWDESVCTQDAKMCPDGSYVSRQGPNCEFAKCPGL